MAYLIQAPGGAPLFPLPKSSPKNSRRRMPSRSHSYLKEYAGEVQLAAITETWLEGYQAFLRERDSLGESTCAKYYAATVYVLRRAVRDRILPGTGEAVKV